MRAVERTLAILEILGSTDQGVRLADLCRLSGLDGSTALRYLDTLVKLGYASTEAGDKLRYRAGYRLARLSGSSEVTILQRAARPIMEALRDACGEDVNLGTLDAGSALCLETQKSSHILGTNFASGLRIPAHASSLGKAILAFLPEAGRRAVLRNVKFVAYTPNTIMSLDRLEAELAEVRRRGWAVDREEFTPAVVCIGAPIFNADGRVVAALSITAPTQRISADELEARYSALLLEACADVSRQMGFRADADRAVPRSAAQGS